MRKFAAVFFVLVLMSAGMSGAAYATNCYKAPETMSDKTGDWFATFGKTGKEKTQILARRKYGRFTACVQKNLETGPRGKFSGPHKGERFEDFQ